MALGALRMNSDVPVESAFLHHILVMGKGTVGTGLMNQRIYAE